MSAAAYHYLLVLNMSIQMNDEEDAIAAYLGKIRCEKKQLENIIAQTQVLENEQNRSRQMMIQSSVSFESRDTMQKKIEMAENRLNDALVKFNSKCQENKSLRDQIVERRRIRCLYDEILSRLEMEIMKQTQKMQKEVELKKKIDSSLVQVQASFVAAKKELEKSRSLVQESNEELVSLKEKLRQERDNDIRSQQHRCKTAASSSSASNSLMPTGEEEQYDDEVYDQKRLDESLEQLLNLTGDANAEAFVDRLTGLQERNMSRFQAISELEAELGRVEHNIDRATQQLKRMKNRGLNFKMQQLTDHKLAEKKRQVVNKRKDNLDKEYTLHLKMWHQMRQCIFDTHKKLKLPMPPDTMLGSDSVSESNVFAYLAGMEKKASEIISAISNECDEDECEGTTSPTHSCRSFDTSRASLCFNLPSVKDIPNDDDGERPFTFDELRSRCK